MAFSNASDKPSIYFNIISILISLLSLTLGMIVWYLIDFQPAFYLELLIGTLFLALPVIKKFIGLKPSVLLFFIILNSAFVFYGIILGPVASIPLLTVFLMGASHLLIANKKIRNLFWGYVCITVIFLETNYIFNWLPPITILPQSLLIIRLIVIATGTTLNGIVLFFYINTLKKASESKTKYLRETTHEIRTPLNSIMGIAEGLNDKLTLLNDPALRSTFRKETEQLQIASLMIREIINNQLDLAKIEEGRFNEVNNESFNLRECINECILMLRPIASSRRINIILNYDSRLPEYIITDKTIISKIINNLTSNALKYSIEDAVVRFNVLKVNDHINIETNNISSLPKEQLEDIFQPFVSHANKENIAESTGLGLAITQQLVEKIAGTITASKFGNNTIFTLSIPLKEGRKVMETVLPPLVEDMYKDYVILVLEDDSLNQIAIREAIKTMGIEPYFVENGAEGLELLKQIKPDLIITDGKMPVMDGKKFLSILRASSDNNLRNIPVIVASGETFLAEKESFIAVGANDFILKPFSRAELIDVIRKHLPQIKLHAVN
ncbi:response regulator [Chitinophaga sp. HK235]|uniref:ATP-binding response regulator n=1 Tax=Chitinophaga sp. HK235 TaxID=2952571 RepID=UPI001BABABF3|nr:response regulator [Chitinophaga sp. HK235]